MQPMKMKLALMSSQVSWGGGEQFLWSLGNGLIQRGHSVLWVCDEASPLFGRLQNVGFDCVAMAGRIPKPQSLLRLRKTLSKHGTQILHANDSHSLIWGSLAMLGKVGIKRVGVKHTAFPIRSAVRYNWMLDAVVCVSNAVRDVCIQGGVAGRKTHVIHGGLEPPQLEHWVERFWACEHLGIDQRTPLFSAVGSLSQCKGYERLIEAAHHLRWHLPEFCVVICGEGNARPELEQLVRKYDLQNHVRLLGFQERPERWICASDAFVHPSLSEGLSLVTIQAQMIGTPVIATEVGGLREVLRKPGTGELLGWPIHGNDPATLADLMKLSIENTPARHAMVQAAKESAVERFDLNQMIDKFERLYLKMLQRGSELPEIGEIATLRNSG
jgi:glycosyltransferase involved in cell wall biosynthesis